MVSKCKMMGVEVNSIGGEISALSSPGTPDMKIEPSSRATPIITLVLLNFPAPRSFPGESVERP